MLNGPEIIKQSLNPDKRVKYDPDRIGKDAGMSPSERRIRARKGRGSITDWQEQNYIRQTAGISGLARAVLEAISPDDSQDEIQEIPTEIVLGIGNRSSSKPVFISNAPYRPKPAD